MNQFLLRNRRVLKTGRSIKRFTDMLYIWEISLIEDFDKMIESSLSVQEDLDIF